ncbi:MAG: type II toxin-antitoxin system VapC family toxin [Streptococcus sp.]|jgi:tRNA(fMet)-specific endonuclease VapC|nr:type II toxin-antitoxin system VapC family toxin [Streptococcus sp.]
MWLLDTNVWIGYLNPAPSQVKRHIGAHRIEDLILCDVVKAELYYGAFKSARRDANLVLVDRLCSAFSSLPFDGRAARRFGEIRAELTRQGQPIGPYDMLIAAIALANGCILVTHNTAEFSRIPGLHLEDWE